MMPSERDQIVRVLFGAIAIGTLVLAGYAIYLQWSTPSVDCTLDWASGHVLDVPQDSHANYAGLQPGDVILNIEGVPFQKWSSREIENRRVEIRRGDQILTLELPLLPLALVNLPNLVSALVVWLTFWCIGIFLVWRRFREIAARLFFLLTQSIGIGLLFLLAYPQALNRPGWMAVLISVGFHLAGALVVHYYLFFPVTLGTPRQRALTMNVIYPGMLMALACRLFLGDLGMRASFLYNTLEISGAIGLSLYSYLRRATPDGRRRLRLVIGGNLVAALPSFAFFLLPTILGSSRMPDWMVGPFILISPVSYLFAILRDNLFHIDRVLNRTIVYVILSLGILILYLGPFLLIYRFAPGDWLAQTMIAAALTLLIGFAFEWSRAQVQRWVDRFFYGGWYDYPRVVETISAALARCIERAQLNDVLTHQVAALMQLRKGQFVAPGDDTHTGESTLDLPLAFQNETRAIWRVGGRRDDEDWSATDRRILATLARQAEVALGNVLLVEMLHQQLDVIRATQHQLIRSREAERARLARDLHDGPIQDLVGLNMQLGLLLADLPGFRASDLESLLATQRGAVRDLLSELRQVCAELRPPMLDTIGLSAALRVLADEWSSQHNLSIQLDLAPDAILRALPSEVAVNLYRVTQEALSNIARHAQACNVALHLAFDSACLTLTIRDDGHGFAAPATLHELAAHGHFGLVGMRERVELIGGALTVESEPGKGTTVRVSWANSLPV
jgi:signal transduction histidine kinase